MAQGDEALLALLATNLSWYFKELVVRYQHQLYSFALRQVGNHQDAEDIVQEAFIRAYYALGDFSAAQLRVLRLQPWLYKITLNIFYTHVQKKSKLATISLDASAENITLDIENDWREQPEPVLEEAEGIRALGALVAGLPVHYRTPISLYYFEEFSYREIAELLDQPMGTVKSYLYRGTRLLRDALAVQTGKEGKVHGT